MANIVKFREQFCKGCSLCVQACPRKILRLSDRVNAKGYKVAECIDTKKCIACGMCFAMCPDVVIEVVSGQDDGRTQSPS